MLRRNSFRAVLDNSSVTPRFEPTPTGVVDRSKILCSNRWNEKEGQPAELRTRFIFARTAVPELEFARPGEGFSMTCAKPLGVLIFATALSTFGHAQLGGFAQGVAD